MLKRLVRNEQAFLARRCAPVFLLLLGLLVLAPPSRAQINLGPVTIGGGLQTSFVHTEPDHGTSTDQFQLNHARLYVNGPVTDSIKFMFNTDYDSITNKLTVLDAVAQIGKTPEFNIWAGRFLPRATVRISTARSTRMSGQSTQTASRTDIPLSIKAASTALPIGGPLPRK